MERHTLESTAKRMSRHRARGELRQAWLCAVELTNADPRSGRWWAHRGDLAADLGDDDDMLRAMRQAAYLFRREGSPARAMSVSMWLQRRGIELDGAAGLRGPRRRAWRSAS